MKTTDELIEDIDRDLAKWFLLNKAQSEWLIERVQQAALHAKEEEQSRLVGFSPVVDMPVSLNELLDAARADAKAERDKESQEGGTFNQG